MSKGISLLEIVFLNENGLFFVWVEGEDIGLFDTTISSEELYLQS